MQQKIIAFDRDAQGDWRAKLACHHYQHVRHNPPFVSRPWVMSAAGRESMIGEMLDCLHCDSLEKDGSS